MKIKNPILLKFGGWLMFILSRMWMSTMPMKALLPDTNLDPAVADPNPDRPRRRIYLFWHEYILCPFYLRGGCHLTMLLSQHIDATILFHAAQWAGFGVVRGSTRKGGTGALREMMTVSKENVHLTITPDGPQGPRRHLAPGALFLSSQLQMPIVLMGFGYDRPWRFNSWDKFALPRPFSRARIIFSEEIIIPPDLSKEEIEQYRQDLERRLVELSDEAERWAQSGEKRDGETIADRRSYGTVSYPERKSEQQDNI